MNVGSAYPWTGKGAAPQWGNPDSAKAYGHAKTRRSSSRPFRELENRADTFELDQRQWYDDLDYVEAEQLAPMRSGQFVIDVGRRIGRVIHSKNANGVRPAPTLDVTRAFVQRNQDGTINTAYPVTDAFVIA